MIHSTAHARRALWLVEQAAGELTAADPHTPVTHDPATQEGLADILTELIREGAPDVHWQIPTTATAHRGLEGQLSGSDTRQLLRALSVWQGLVGAGPVSIRRPEGYEHHSVVGSYRGARVRVVTVVPAPAGDAA